MNRNWRHSILFLATLSVVVVAALIGTLFVFRTAVVTEARTQEAWTAQIEGLLDTTANTAGAACFVGDATLAAEVARGLSQNPQVHAVTIVGPKGVLAQVEDRPLPTDLRQRAATRMVSRQIDSPFQPGMAVCEVRLVPDPVEFDRAINDEVGFVGSLLVMQLIGVAAAVSLLILLTITRPVKMLSDRLHHMQPARGDRLPVPEGHARTELGRLVDDINDLASQLVTSLEEERAQRLLREQDERKYHAIFDKADSGIFVADRQTRLTSRNPALSRFLGLAARGDAAAGDVAAGQAAAGASGANDSAAAELHLDALAWRDAEQLREIFARCLDSNQMISADLEFAPPGHANAWFGLVLTPIGEGLVQGVMHDVTERRRSEESARIQAITDPLTGVGNAAGISQQLRNFLDAAGDDTPFAVMRLDLDGFKRVNEGLGLPIGDNILKIAATRVRGCIKASDMLARLGGDDFVLILPHVRHEEHAAAIGDRIVRALGRSFDVHQTPVLLGASIGVALAPNDGADLPTLLRNAELAMNRARASGGARIAFFDPAMAETAVQRRQLEADLRLALRRNEFLLYYQPIMDLATHRVIGAEALIRWRHGEKGLVPPDAFIPVAEETGIICDIGIWALVQVCHQLACWKDAGCELYASLNISGRQIPDGLPPEMIAAVVRRHGLEPAHLALEITEGVLLADIARAQHWLAAVREAGFRVYLDDFGTGYSSLSYLKRFPVDTVKIDKSFVRDMGADASDRALVAAIISMAGSLGLTVVAEGVENAAQMASLCELGCQYAQGFHFSRPLPAEEFCGVAERLSAPRGAQTLFAVP